MATKKQKGNQFYKKGQFKEAITQYKEHIEETEDNVQNVYINMALCYFKLKDYQQSLDACSEAINLDNGYAKAYYWRVRSQRQLLKEPKVDRRTLLYGVYYDSLMFTQYCEKQKSFDELEEMKNLRKEAYQVFGYSQPEDKNSVLKDMLAIEDDHIKALAQQSCFEEISLNENDKIRHEINQRNKQMLGMKDKHIIKQLKKQIKNLIAKLEAQKSQGDEKDDEKENQQTKELESQVKNEEKPKIEEQQINKIQSEVKNEEKHKIQKFQPKQKVEKVQIQVKNEKKVESQQKQKKQQAETKTQESSKLESQLTVNKSQVKEEKKEQAEKEQIQIPENLSDDELYQYFKMHSQKSRDIFGDFVSIITKLLINEKLSVELKNRILVLISKREGRFSILRMSYTQKEREELKNRLEKAQIEKEIVDMYIKK